MQKIFIIDTNVIISDPNSIFKFEDNDVVIPISVIEEIDHFKKDQSEKGRNARECSRILDRFRTKGSLAKGVPLHEDKPNSGKIFVFLGKEINLLPNLLESNTDNHILAVGLSLQKQYGPSRKVVVITKDSNLRIKADAFGLDSEDFEADKVDISELYSGTESMKVSAETLQKFSQEGTLGPNTRQFLANQFVVVKDEADKDHMLFGYYNKDSNQIKRIGSYSEKVWGVTPRNPEQHFALWALLEDKIKLITLTGSAGTGKTLLAIAAGLSKTTDEDIYQKILISRPIFALGKDIGFLPGDIEEKLNPWMQPIYDSLDFLLNGTFHPRNKKIQKSYHDLIHQGILEVEPLTYIRGRSLPNAFFIVDEAQNLTPHEIKTIITRAGENTKIILTGDPFQIDNPYLDSTNNGLTYVIERFKNAKIAAHVTLTRGERSELATLAAELL